ncbi:MAG: DNA repair protein RecN [Bdellovibrionales bacterium]|nr:DNA repair protein RecN [Bdellovibrionales bacterium]
MLAQISISDLAIVPEAKVDFDEQFNVLTGETGAGKSILIEAISLLAGRKASQDDVRMGAEKAQVYGEIRFQEIDSIRSFLDESGIELDEDRVIVRRVISKDGRSKAFINDTSCTVSLLQKFSFYWLDITSQHGSQRLMDESSHIDLLDEHASLGPDLQSYQNVYDELKSVESSLKQIEEKKQKARQEREFLEFQSKELQGAKLKDHEMEEIESILQKEKHGEKLAHAFSEIEQAFHGERDLISNFSHVSKNLERVSNLDEAIGGLVERSQEIDILLLDLREQLREYRRHLSIDSTQIEELNHRMAVLQKITRKYGSVEQAIEKRDQIATLLESLDDDSQEEVELKDKQKKLRVDLEKLAQGLTEKRTHAAERLGEKISLELTGLGMGQAEICFYVESCKDLKGHASGIECGELRFHRKGQDQVSIRFSPNPGEGFRALSSIASGGELSRILLAVKGVSIERGKSPDVSFLFDEVDTGIGGETADRLGLQMMKLSQGRQVFCVTHLAQVACYAHHHYKVEKKMDGKRTMARIFKLSAEEKKSELGRMIGGIENSAPILAHAQELYQKGLAASSQAS